jgi:hypothetical protein
LIQFILFYYFWKGTYGLLGIFNFFNFILILFLAHKEATLFPGRKDYSPWRIDPYTRPIPGWMRECKQKLAPIFVLVD